MAIGKWMGNLVNIEYNEIADNVRAKQISVYLQFTYFRFNSAN